MSEEDMERLDSAMQSERGDAEVLMEPPCERIKVETDFESTSEEIIKEENFEETENAEGLEIGKYTMIENAGEAETLIEPLFIPIKAEPDFENMSEETIMEENFEAGELTEVYSKGITLQSNIDYSAMSSFSEVFSSSFQSLSTEVMGMKNEKYHSKIVCSSEPDTMLLQSLPFQKAFPVASTSTTDCIEGEEEYAGSYLSWHGEEPVAALRQKSDKRKGRGCANSEGTRPVDMSEIPFKCNLCEKIFKRRDILITHMRTHSGEKPFKCGHCDMSFAQNGNLTTHLRTHTGEKPYKCEQCGKSFSRSDKLTVHMRTHSGERPFECSQCEMSFTQSWSLTMHMRTHTGEEPYKCEQCGKPFKRSDNLTAHMRTHTGEKPYKCEECGKTFKSRAKLTSHSKTHSGQKFF